MESNRQLTRAPSEDCGKETERILNNEQSEGLRRVNSVCKMSWAEDTASP